MKKQFIYTKILPVIAGSMLFLSLYGQNVTIPQKETRLIEIFKEIKKQTGYGFVYSTADIQDVNNIRISPGERDLDDLLKEILKDQPFEYTVSNRLITVRKKEVSIPGRTVQVPRQEQDIIHVRGRVVDNNGKSIRGASIRIKDANKGITTDIEGFFELKDVDPKSIIRITYLGYEPLEMVVRENLGTINLIASDFSLEEVEVMNTGYFQTPKERATGSFTFIDQKAIERNPSTSILQRLEGMTSGLQFVNASGSKPSDIRIRGLSTLQGNKRPLIVIDNFPYEGNLSRSGNLEDSYDVDLSFINPNDIESVTVLKDAAAASIWGAKAGNGVIVITTKNGKYGQKSRINFSHTSTFDQKPDLMYSQRRLPSDAILEIEKKRFDRGDYAPSSSQSVIPEYAEWLYKFDRGEINAGELSAKEDLFRNTEVRNDIAKYLMQTSIQQQYNLNLSGGSSDYAYYISAGYNQGRSNWIGQKDQRVNLSTEHRIRPVKNLELMARVNYSKTKNHNNSVSIGDLTLGHGIGLSPYMRLVDESGNPLSIIKGYRQSYKDQEMQNGLLDWNYVPLDEQNLKNDMSNAQEIRFSTEASYSFLNMFRANVAFQHSQGTTDSERYYDKDTYYVRDLVNRFTDADFKQQIPYGDIRIIGTPYTSKFNSMRATLNMDKTFLTDHEVVALAGAEVSESIRNSSAGHYFYNYNKNIEQGETQLNYNERYPVRPSGSAYIPSQFPINTVKYTDRYLSYFGNASYSYQKKYVATASLRWDASNLFGVKTNQKGTPLWSIGGLWNIDSESFYDVNWLPQLRLRLTHGSAGNVYKDVSHFATIRNNIATPNNEIQGTIVSTGNPSLRWEKVSTTNTGIDFSALSYRIKGSLDYFVKKADDLIGEDYLAPSTGVITGGTAANSKLINYASMTTRGMDLSLTSHNLIGDFKWNSTVLFSVSKNKIREVYTNPNAIIYDYFNNPPAPVVGVSRDLLYSIPWNGLSPETGLPLLYLEGEETTEYTAYINQLKADMLIHSGLSVDPYYGSLRNEFIWKGFDLSFLITWKSGSVFRRSSMASGAEYNGTYHQDYYKRWEKPGDELTTHVPAYSDTYNNYLATIYNQSQILITKGDLIRLNDINLGYTIHKNQFVKLPFQSLRVTARAANLGLLWKANKYDIDPDYAHADYVLPKSFSIGMNINF